MIGPGTVLVHRSGGAVVIARRKPDHSGWWNTDGSGLSDHALTIPGEWSVIWPPATLPSVRERRQGASEDARSRPGPRCVPVLRPVALGSQGGALPTMQGDGR